MHSLLSRALVALAIYIPPVVRLAQAAREPRFLSASQLVLDVASPCG